MKNIFKLLIVLFAVQNLPAQTAFPYSQEWSTYVGGGQTKLYTVSSPEGFFFDSAKNIYLEGTSLKLQENTISYYNQFIIGGGNPFDAAAPFGTNRYAVKFSNAGSMLFAGYTGANLAYEQLAGIDSQDNKYYIRRYDALVPNLATNNVWMQNNSSNASNFSYTLTKKNTANAVLWTSYLPNAEDTTDSNYIKIDADDNVYIFGDTKQNIAGISTSNTFQQAYMNFGIGYNNGYMVKLNPAGQQIWGTYFPTVIGSAQIYNNGIYFLSNDIPNLPSNVITAGTFQTAKAFQILMKFDAATGDRVWGTYYGIPNSGTYFGGITDLKVNETGLYGFGFLDKGFGVNAADLGYYATPGAFQSIIKGDSDFFLSKFDLTGNRIWSTYYGSNDYDIVLGSGGMSILGNKIIISGNQYGSDNIATPNSFLSTPPNANVTGNNTNQLFAEFDADGNHKWTSYFGGAGTMGSYAEEINPELSTDGDLYLWGSTTAPNNVATLNGHHNTMINPLPGVQFGFISKFILKERLATSETDLAKDLVLYDNPNDGNFSLAGNILTKQQCALFLYDVSGKLIHKQQLSKDKKQNFNLKNLLLPGNYMMQINNTNGAKVKVFKLIVQ